ncbi:hypothetical protein E2C01_056131 [Portunus trituberculatus]|uniref:Uncharacterized protein n=1 Tax=Portunus trituberculatus TaxID=210409 RepID=A0A5B7GPI8_PORTR|nr:hypothetical protein [Portunus trituberculatus]
MCLSGPISARQCFRLASSSPHPAPDTFAPAHRALDSPSNTTRAATPCLIVPASLNSCLHKTLSLSDRSPLSPRHA